MRTRTKAKIAGKTAVAMVEHPSLRRAALTVGPPVAKVRFGIVRRRARRRAIERGAQLQQAARTASSALNAYAPQAAEALGLREQPKPKRAPSIAFGFALGAGAAYFLDPAQGSGRRASVIALVQGGGESTVSQPTTTSDPAPTAAPTPV